MGHNSLNETAYYIHILPENLSKTPAVNWDVFENMFPNPLAISGNQSDNNVGVID